MDPIQKQKILSIDITLKKLRALGPNTALNDAGIYWTFERGAFKVSCGVFEAGSRWVFASTVNGVTSEAQMKALTTRLRPLAYYDSDLDETIRVGNRRAAQVKQVVDEVLGRPS